MGVCLCLDVDMKAISTAQTIPVSSGTQKPFGRLPRTPRHSGDVDSSSVDTAESFRTAEMRAATVAASVTPVCWMTSWRKAPVRPEIWRRKLLIGW